MGNRICVNTTDGTPIEYLDVPIGQGAMKIAYFTSSKTEVVAFYKDRQESTALDRLENIVQKYSPIQEALGGNYWKKLYCWPTRVIAGERLGIVLPAYPKHFYFNAGPMKGKEKEGKWFASAMLRKLLDPREKGDWRSYFNINILISRAVRRMHTSGLAHSDLSYKNVLIDPQGGNATIIDIDGLVVPNKFPPDVLGTPDFIAPEVYRTIGLNFKDPKRQMPSRHTDLHALAVLIYMYLLYRHPLRGGKVHDLDPVKDEQLAMGANALFIENPHDTSNRPKNIDARFLPWADIGKIPYSVTGPYLKRLFDRAFIDGLHTPPCRPTADEWESELIRTLDLMHPCKNPECEQKWFVVDTDKAPVCPFCGWKLSGLLPILNFYSSKRIGQYQTENHRLIIFNDRYLYKWHINSKISPDEKLSREDKKTVGYFSFYKGKWLLINQNIPDLKDVGSNKKIPLNSSVELRDKQQLLLSKVSGGKLVFIQMATI